MRIRHQFVLIVLALSLAPVAQADREHQLKAAFIFNFAKYIQWPQGLGDANAPFVIGVYGTDTYGDELDNALRGKLIAGHPIEVEGIGSDSSVRNCRIVVTGANSEDRIAQLQRLCRTSGTVLIGEAPDFARMGGTVGFTIDSGKIRFDVNLVSARANNLVISSKMLSLARLVVR